MIIIPHQMSKLPRDQRGYPIPWFVATMDDGTRDFRVLRPGGVSEAVTLRKCWICGNALGPRATFVLGAANFIARINPEPPSHHECAKFAVTTCPYIANPSMKRSPRPTPEGTFTLETPDKMHRTYCLWSTRHWELRKLNIHISTHVVEIGEPSGYAPQWYREGREATPAEILAAFNIAYQLMGEQS